MDDIPTEIPTTEIGSEITDAPPDTGSETTPLEKVLTGQEVTPSQQESIEHTSSQKEVQVGEEIGGLLEETINRRLEDAKRIFQDTVGGPVQEYFTDMRNALKDILGEGNEKALYENTVGPVDIKIGITMEEYEKQMLRIQSRFQGNENIIELGSKEKPYEPAPGYNIDTALRNVFLGGQKGWGDALKGQGYYFRWGGVDYKVGPNLTIDLSETMSDGSHEESLMRMRKQVERFKNDPKNQDLLKNINGK